MLTSKTIENQWFSMVLGGWRVILEAGRSSGLSRWYTGWHLAGWLAGWLAGGLAGGGWGWLGGWLATRPGAERTQSG